jgi:NAD(P) transhydrogenase
MTEDYDLIAIGSGPAGESAADLASFFGHRCAVVEMAKPGGTVTTTGGVPTKTLREAALYFSGFREGDLYGLRTIATAEVSTPLIRKRTWDVCEMLQDLTARNLAHNSVDYVQGTARLNPNRSIAVTGKDGKERTLRAKMVLIATGSRPVRPKGVPFNIPGVCDTDTVLNRGWLPKDIVIVGGGPVGVEFATICHALGAKVTIVDRSDRPIGMMDGEISDRMSQLFEQWGITIRCACTVEAVEPREGGLRIGLSTGESLDADTILFAAGRAANSDGMGLEGAGVAVDSRGRVVVDSSFKTTAEGVYAAGDVLGPTLASIAMEQGRAAVCHAFGIPFEGTVDPAPVSAVYGMPELSGAGLTEEQCREQGLDYQAGRSDLSLTPRGAISGRGGLLKLIFLKGSRKLVGVHCIGDIASEIVGIGQMAIRCGGTANTLANMSMNTPTYSYAYKYAAFDALRRMAAAEGRVAEVASITGR